MQEGVGREVPGKGRCEKGMEGKVWEGKVQEGAGREKDSRVPQNGLLYEPWLLLQVCPVFVTPDVESLDVHIHAKFEHLKIARLISQNL